MSSAGPAEFENAAAMSPARFPFAGGDRPPAHRSMGSPVCSVAVSRGDHARGDGAVGLGIDQDECAGAAILAVKVERDGAQQVER